MNQDQFLGILKIIASSGVAYVVGKGWIPVGASADVVAGVVAVGAAGWSYVAHTDAAKVTAAAAVPGVAKVLVDNTAASSVAAIARDPSVPNVQKGP